MPYRDARCAFVARSIGEAEMIVGFLAGHDIEAKVIDAAAFGMLDGIAGLAGSSARGVEVWTDPSHHPEVARLLAERTAIIDEREAKGKDHGPTEVVCEKCGRKATFAADLYGTIQECPKCGAYLDVGDSADEEWDVGEMLLDEDMPLEPEDDAADK